MSAVVLPITAGTNQTFTTTLPVNGGNVTLRMALTWNDAGGYWALTIWTGSGTLLLDGVAVVPGNFPAANFLAPWDYLGIGAAYLVAGTTSLGSYPTFDNLGQPTDASTPTWAIVWTDNAA